MTQKNSIKRFLGDLSHNKLAAVFLVMIAVSTLLGAGVEFFRYGQEFFYGSRQAAPGEKFIPIVGKLSGQKTVGFIAEGKENQEDYWTDFFQLQNVLAPIIVYEGTIPEFIIASGFSLSSINSLKERMGIKTEIIGKFPNQIFLLRKK